jgi:acyl-CoA synthetase (NDP forming)
MTAYRTISSGESASPLAIRVIPEPQVKRQLSRAGVAVPNGVVLGAESDAASAIAQLREPLVLKAFGPQIIHKSEIGAVRLALTRPEVPAATADMTEALNRQGISVEGLLVEEQQSPGVELLVGVVLGSSRVPHIALGLGGTLTELLNAITVRLLPLTRAAAEGMLAALPGKELLMGYRGGTAVDRDALVDLLLGIGGQGGLVDRLLPEGLLELECNPVIASAEGAVAVDARLILGAPGDADVGERALRDLTPLFSPSSIAVAGASTRRHNLANVALAAYRAAGWTDHLYALHPTASEIDGVPAAPTIADIASRTDDGRVDYLKIAVPAASVADIIRSGAGRVGVAQVVTGGFGELDDVGRQAERDLLSAARTTQIPVIGPNCMGAFSPAGGQTFQVRAPRDAGGVGIVSQSGGVTGDLILEGAAHGLKFSKVVSIGNAIDVSVGEMLEFLVDDPDTTIIGLYLEGLADGPRVVRALRRAGGVKPVVLLMVGLSEQGAVATASHTGALAADRVFVDALCAETGVARVDTLEDLIAVLAYHQRYQGVRANDDDALLVVGAGGGASSLAAEAAARRGIPLPPIARDLAEQLAAIDLGPPKVIVNPLEVIMSPIHDPRVLETALAKVREGQAFSDVLVHLSLATFFGLTDPGVAQFEEIVRTLERCAEDPWRVALVARNDGAASDEDLRFVKDTVKRADLPLYHTLDQALSGIAASMIFDRVRRDRGVGVA